MAWDPLHPTFSQRLLLALAPPLGAMLLRSLALTWRLRILRGAELQPKHRDRPTAYAFWHEGILSLGAAFRDQPYRSLISRSFDGELIARAALRLGQAPALRGSSSRGGAEALLEMAEVLSGQGHVTVTVDGPRGPRRQAKDGILKAAQRSGCEVVALGVAAPWSLRFKSWDRSLLPLPFSRVFVAFGRPFRVGEGAEGLAKGRRRLEAEMRELTAEAEREAGAEEGS